MHPGTERVVEARGEGLSPLNRNSKRSFFSVSEYNRCSKSSLDMERAAAACTEASRSGIHCYCFHSNTHTHTKNTRAHAHVLSLRPLALTIAVAFWGFGEKVGLKTREQCPRRPCRRHHRHQLLLPRLHLHLLHLLAPASNAQT